MVSKHIVALSFLLGVAGGFVAYALAWGLFATHQELGMDSRSALLIAAWTVPIVFGASLIYFAARNAGRRY
ncbi:MAG TPA: hypothetical protein VLT90_04685 [Terriglobales bacterium]|nr:hypothetical protein [Terriglobales bacterium]